MSPLQQQIVLEARQSVGVLEVGHNDGPEVREWLRRVGRRPGNPWCAAFAWCKLDDACSALGLSNPVPETAGVHLLATRARARGALVYSPGVGFLCFHDSGHSAEGAHLGHCGVVVEVGDDGRVRTVEGNTNEAGSREGDCVAEKWRRADYWGLGYLDPTRLFSP